MARDGGEGEAQPHPQIRRCLGEERGGAGQVGEVRGRREEGEEERGERVVRREERERERERERGERERREKRERERSGFVFVFILFSVTRMEGLLGCSQPSSVLFQTTFVTMLVCLFYS